MNGLPKKCEKPPFLGILGQNGQFWKFLAKMGKTGIFFRKALGTFFSRLQALTNCKLSEKSNVRFSSNRVTYRRTERQTRILRSPKDFVERPNMLKTPIFGRLGQKCRFWTIFGKKGPFSNFRRKSENVTFLLIFFKILMHGFSRKWARYVRMNGCESKGPSTPSRDQKSENSN